jgi:hypothetical protein
MSAVIDNSRTEPEGLRTPADAKRKDDAEPLAGKKWIHSLVKADQNEFGAFALTMEEAEEVVGRVEQPRTQRCPETPRKAIKTETFMTPGSKRKWEGEALPTPVTGVVKDEDVFTASNRKLEENMWGGNEHFGLRSPSATPTPSRFRDISEVGEPMGKTKIEYDISKDVMELLRDHKIDDDTRDSLLKMLRKHTVKMSGIAKGRDISRAALKAKDTQIAELQQKITALEVSPISTYLLFCWPRALVSLLPAPEPSPGDFFWSCNLIHDTRNARWIRPLLGTLSLIWRRVSLRSVAEVEGEAILEHQQGNSS